LLLLALLLELPVSGAAADVLVAAATTMRCTCGVLIAAEAGRKLFPTIRLC
jgi:hypothetical protein